MQDPFEQVLLAGQSPFWVHLQTPAMHWLVAPAQTVPQPPQLFLSVPFVLMHMLPQTVFAHGVQRLFTQVAVLPQTPGTLGSQSSLQIPLSQ